jgi:hypothetical protein
MLESVFFQARAQAHPGARMPPQRECVSAAGTPSPWVDQAPGTPRTLQAVDPVPDSPGELVTPGNQVHPDMRTVASDTSGLALYPLPSSDRKLDLKVIEP